MEAKAAYRDRPDEQVAILDALCERASDGMTVFELRAAVDSDIDTIESALAELKEAGLITVDRDSGTVRVYPHDRVVPDPGDVAEEEAGLFEELRRRFGL